MPPQKRLPIGECRLGVEFVHDVAHRVQIRKTVFLIRLQMAALAPFVPGVDKNILQVFWQIRAGMLRHGAQGSNEHIRRSAFKR